MIAPGISGTARGRNPSELRPSPSKLNVYWFDDKNPGSVGSNDVRESMTPKPPTPPSQITDGH